MTTTILNRTHRLRAGLGRWWPALLALALAAATWGIDTVSAARVLPLLPLLYVVAAVVRRRGASWPLLVLGILGYLVLDRLTGVDPTIVIIAVAAAVTAGGLLRRTGRAELLLQAGGMVLFAGVAVLGLAVAPEVARYLIAAGWLGHGVWDLVHLRRGAVVSGSYAQWCAVIDIVLAAELLIGA